MSRQILLILLFALLTLLGCGGGGEQAKNDGSGSEIVGVVQTDTDSRMARATNPVPDAALFLFNSSYLAVGGENAETYSEIDGRFSIPNTPSDHYFLEAFDNSTGVAKSRIKKVIVTGEEDVVDVGEMNLELPATVKCRIKLPAELQLLGSVKYSIYVVGTRVHSTGDENNITVDLANIPTGERLTVRAVLHEPVPLSASQEVDLSPGMSLIIELNEWL